MSDSALDAKEIERRLRNLTPRQCQVLYWVGRGLVYKEIAKLMRCSQDLIQKEMSLMYQTLGLKPLRTSEKRRLLNTQICPIHQRMVSDPERDCAAGVIDATPPTIDEETLKEVIEDEQKGLVPLDVALIRLVQQGPEAAPEETSRQQRLTTVPPNSKSLAPPYRRQSPLPWILVGILGTLLCVAAAAIVILITREPSTLAQYPPTAGPIAPTQATQAAPATTFLMPTSPVPTTTAQVVVATRVPIVVTPTVSPEEQDPAPGSIIAAGQGYTKNGVTLTLKNQIDLRSYYLGTPLFGFQMIIENRSGRQLIVLWKNASVHAKDDKGRSYERGAALGEENWRRDKQFTLDNGKSKIMQMNSSAMGDNDDDFAPFIGPIDSSAKYLIFTIDQMAGLSNLNWKYDLP